jgi:hypothetical protein
MSGQNNMMGGGSGEDEFGKSFLSDIKNFFGSMAYKGGVGT